MPVRVRDSISPLAASDFTASRMTERLAPNSRPSSASLGSAASGPEIAAHDAVAELVEHMGKEAALAGKAAAEGGSVEIRHGIYEYRTSTPLDRTRAKLSDNRIKTS